MATRRRPKWRTPSRTLTAAFRVRTLTVLTRIVERSVSWNDGYVEFDVVGPGQVLTVTYPLSIAAVTETIYTVKHESFLEERRGEEILAISPPGQWLPN